MNLCSVCDKEIQGSWCKNCRRFVKTYTLPDDIYLNKSHDPHHDDDCTYHTPQTAAKNVQTHSSGSSTAAAQAKPQTNAQVNTRTNTQAKTYTNTQTGTRTNTQTKTYTNTQAASRTNTQTGTQTRKKNARRNRILFVIIIFYVIFMLTRIILPFVIDAGLSSELKSFFEDTFQKKKETHCDNLHMDWELSEFEDWLFELPRVVFEVAEESEPPYEYSEGSEEYYGTYREYHGTGNFWVEVDYDTKTEELHEILLICDFTEKHMDLCYEFLKKLDPKTKWSKEKLSEEIEDNMVLDKYITIYTSDTLVIGVQEGEYDLFIDFFPAS